MAGVLIDGDPAATILETQRLGYNGTTLSEFATTTVPQIIGNFELAGSIASFASLESITGWAALANGTVYIKCLATGTVVTAVFTSTAPTWDNAKMGWYGTGASAAHRYLFQLTKGGAASYEDKRVLLPQGNIYVTVPANYLIDASATDDEVFLAISPYVPNVGDFCVVTGGIEKSGSTVTCSIASRSSSTVVTINGMTEGGSTASTAFTSGGGTTTAVSIAIGSKIE